MTSSQNLCKTNNNGKKSNNSNIGIKEKKMETTTL